MGKTEDKWNANYDALKAFVETYRHLPNKKKVENRGLLNWWKYNQPGQTHQNYSDKNCNISNCKALIINALDLFMLDIFRIFIV